MVPCFWDYCNSDIKNFCIIWQDCCGHLFPSRYTTEQAYFLLKFLDRIFCASTSQGRSSWECHRSNGENQLQGFEPVSKCLFYNLDCVMFSKHKCTRVGGGLHVHLQKPSKFCPKYAIKHNNRGPHPDFQVPPPQIFLKMTVHLCLLLLKKYEIK